MLLRIPFKYVPIFLHAYVRKHQRLETQRKEGTIEMEDEQTRRPSEDAHGEHSALTASQLVRISRHGDLL